MHITRTHYFEEKASEMPNLSSHLFSLQKKKKKSHLKPVLSYYTFIHFLNLMVTFLFWNNFYFEFRSFKK